MASRVFALIIGIDEYKSGNVWNLESCVDDAQNIRRWLTNGLHVPRNQVCLLINSQATKRAIEDNFMSHLVNNADIDKDDAIIIYFAGHGSSVHSPRGWYNDGMKAVDVLCPYDHDCKSAEGRVAGISDRSFHAMLRDLAQVKGNNITVILDCCFSAHSSDRERRHVRWTPTTKAAPDDLYKGLWTSALAGSSIDTVRGFARTGCDTHIVLAASQPGASAFEGKGGGLFTRALLSVKDAVPLHSLMYDEFLYLVEEAMEGHKPALVGPHKDRILFDGVPFVPDGRFVPVESYGQDKLRIDAGAIHGVVEGTELTLHDHNYNGSINPSLASYSAIEVHPTWCIARRKSQSKAAQDKFNWARVTKWNNRVPFRVHLHRSFFNFFRRCRLRRALDSKTARNASKEGVNIVRVKSATHADMSLTLKKNELLVERYDAMLAANSRRIIHLPSTESRSDVKVVDAAARFHLHLHRKNPSRPLLGLVTMELYRLDNETWTRVSGNLLVDGKAQITDDEKDSVYSVVLHNYSDRDLWPYLVSMDSSGYSISMVYHPDPSNPQAPLKKHSHMIIGSGALDSEALSFTLADGAPMGAAFLKLFVSSEFTPMSFIEQGVPPSATIKQNRPSEEKKSPNEKGEMWDTVLACISVVRGNGLASS
ncbi:hypothetical protein BDW22DRAFT_1360822 [Trametopsis cervina]|nr:hypothetical protein BDW22DRAFT_1360822 [Trametopsis cervina]